jgi:nucleotide-binding universal stress UspA family protein
MKRFKNILAVYDESVGSEAVLDQAVTLARTNGAQLTLVNPVGEKPLSAGALEDAQKRLPRIVPWITQEGVKQVATEVLVGTPYREIIRQVERGGHDLVILSAEGGPHLKKVLFGSTAIDLMRKCPSAVWVLKPAQAVPCARILAAVGPCAEEAEGDAVNARILELATSLACSQQAALHIVHAWAPGGSDAAMLTNEISDDTREGILSRCEATYRTAVNALLADCPVVGLDHEIHLPRGLPQQSIVRLAARLDVDLVVMGAASRAGMSRLLVGNAAETVFAAVRCGILAVKPEAAHPAQSVAAGPRALPRRRAAAAAR